MHLRELFLTAMLGLLAAAGVLLAFLFFGPGYA